MTARADGFGEVLIVKTAAAAANPALATLHFATSTTGLTLSQDPSGYVLAQDPASTTIFRADTPIMWDSSTTPAPAGTPSTAPAHAPAANAKPKTTTKTAAAPRPSDFRKPGDAAHVAKIGLKVGQGDLAVSPDKTLLTSASTTYPLYIDPAWQGSPSVSSWVSVNSNGGNTSTGTDAQLGYDDWDGCGSNCYSTARSFFMMNTDGFKGATVTKATFTPWFTWSADSSDEPTEIYLDPDVPSDLSWGNKPSGNDSTLVTTESFCTGHGGGCGDQGGTTSP